MGRESFQDCSTKGSYVVDVEKMERGMWDLGGRRY